MFGRGRTNDTASADGMGAERRRRAQVETVAASMPLTIWLNPSWAAVAMLPFMGFFPIFGNVPVLNQVAAVGLHLVNSAIAVVLFLLYRYNPTSPRAWMNRFVAFQTLIGFSWGAMIWLLWVPGNAVNNVIVIAPIVAVLWTYAASRSLHLGLYMAGVVPIFALVMARFLDNPQGAASALAFIFPVTFLYTIIIAVGGKKISDTMLRTRFANEDLTSELRGARDEALRKRYEAEAANASKTTFLANMSHELRTPLNAILGFSDIIANETFGPVGVTRYRDYAQDINMSGSHLLAIINDILDIAKIESGKMVVDPMRLDPQRIIDNAMRVVAAKVREKGQHLSVRIAPEANEVFADERAFKQVVINLVTNAVKFTQMGGAITVHGRRCEDGGFELIVEDDGPGIDASLLNKIFQPFNQVDNRYNRQEGGTGLGLSLVRGLAVLHGGKVWIETDLGAGVRAHVQFPPHSQEGRKNPPTAARLTA